MTRALRKPFWEKPESGPFERTQAACFSGQKIRGKAGRDSSAHL